MLDSSTQKMIVALSNEGDKYLDEGAFDDALKSYQAALDLLPEPKHQWEAATSVFTAIGETLYFMANYAEALRPLQHATMCPGGLGNGLIHLRLGQVYYELGDYDKAGDELTRAYMAEGTAIFE